MKTLKIFLFAALCLSPVVASAEGKIAIGAQGGITFPDYHVTNAPSRQYGNKDGWLAGAYLEFGVWTITLRPEVNYVTKGYSIAGLADVKNHYLEIPVLVKINPLSDAVVSPFLVIGPQWSKQMSSDVTVANSTLSYTNTADDWDISAVGGLGIEFNLSQNVAFNVQGRYSYGFRDVDTSTVEIKTRGFYALAGLTIQNAF